MEIKNERINDRYSLQFIKSELQLLKNLARKEVHENYHTDPDFITLKKVNAELWNICEERRDLDEKKDFSENYLKLSRLEYETNDKRAFYKKKLNVRYQSKIMEVKSYKWFKINE